MSTFNQIARALNPQAFFRLNEPSGTTVTDEINGNVGTYSGDVTLQTASLLVNDSANKAAAFGGTNGYASIPNAVSNQPAANDFSIAFIMDCADATQETPLVRKRLGSGNFTQYGIEIKADLQTGGATKNLLLTAHNGSSNTREYKSDNAVIDGNPHFIVGVWDATNDEIRCYVDGVQIPLSATTAGTWPDVDSTTPLTIGGDNVQGQYFTGTLDEVLFFKYALTAGEAYQLYDAARVAAATPSDYEQAIKDDSPHIYYRLGESGGSVAVDSIGNRPSTYGGTVTFAQTSLIETDTADTSVDLNATGGALTAAHDLGTTNNSLTIEAFLKMDATTNGQYALSLPRSGTETGFAIATDSGQLKGYIHNGSTGVFVGGYTYSLNEELHAALTVDPTNGAQLFVNGTLAGSAAAGHTSANIANGDVVIGRKSVGDSYTFSGRVDEVAIYDYALSSTQLTAHYNASSTGVGTVYEDTVAENAGTSDVALDMAPVVAEGVGAADGLSYSLGAGHEVVAMTVGATGGETPLRISDLTLAENAGSTSAIEVGFHFLLTETAGVNHLAAVTFVLSVAETLGMTDAQLVTHTMVLAENLGLTDAVTADQGHLLAEIIGARDASLSGIVAENLVADGMGYRDTIYIALLAVAVENCGLTDAIILEPGIARSIAETMGVLDATVTTQTANRLLAEILGIRDVISQGLGFDITETAGIQQAMAEAVAFYNTMAEVAGNTDALTDAYRLYVVADETIGGSDTLTINQVVNNLIAEGFIFGANIRLVDNGTAWVINTSSKGFSEYDNYYFNSFARQNQRHLAADDDNIYELTGSDDSGTDIGSIVRTGLNHFGSSRKKRVSDLYIGYKSDGTIVVKAIYNMDNEQREAWYELTDTSNAYDNGRFKIGKGAKAVYWAFEWVNVDGADFDLDQVEMHRVDLERRL